MKTFVLALVALCAATLDASACDRRPVRTFIANHRPGIIIPKAAPTYYAPAATAPQQTAPSFPTGGVIVVGYTAPGCANGNCPIR
jgi:hypothetical protein